MAQNKLKNYDLNNGTGASATTFFAGDNTWKAPLTLTTTGTSGAATFTSGTLNIPQYSGGGGSGITWTEVTTTTQTAAVNNGYITNNAARVTVTLPSTATVGQSVLLQGSGAGGWKLAQNASQTIAWDAGSVAGTDITTAGVTGYIQSSDRYDAIEVMCITADTGWVVRNSKGNLTLN